MVEALDRDSIARELAGAFTDERLDRRLGTIVRTMAKNPTASWPSVCTSAELEGAYRFFSNVRVTPDTILSAHFDRTRERASKEARTLVVHDTTDFTFRGGGVRQGLGRLVTSSQTFYG